MAEKQRLVEVEDGTIYPYTEELAALRSTRELTDKEVTAFYKKVGAAPVVEAADAGGEAA